MNANPGDLVICVDAEPIASTQRILLTEGRTYLVTSLGNLKSGDPSYFLAGIVGWLPCEQRPIDYAARRFRKLDAEPLEIERVEHRPIRIGEPA